MVARYVDSAATGLNNGTSWANAWTTFAAVGTLAPGDILYISGGPSTGSKSYGQNFDMSSKIRGSSAARIIVTKGVDAGHNGEVIITGAGNTTPVIQHQNAGQSIGWFTLSNITINPSTYGKRAIYLRNCSNWIIDNCKAKINGSEFGGIHFSLCGNSGSTEIIRNCTVTDSGSQTAQTDGIVIDTPWEGATCIIENNRVILSNDGAGADPHIDTIQTIIWDPTTPGTNKTIIIRNNHLEHTATFGDHQNMVLETSGTQGCTHVIYNNECYMPTSLPYANIIVKGQNTGDISIAKIWNNTIVGNGALGSIAMQYPNSATEIKNNIMVQTGTSGSTYCYNLYTGGSWPSSGNIDYNEAYRTGGGGTAYWATDYTRGPMSKSTFTNTYGFGDNNSLTTNPLLVGPPGDMTLTSGSPAINHATTLNFTTITGGSNTDKFGTARPQGASWDIGSFEFISGGTVWFSSTQFTSIFNLGAGNTGTVSIIFDLTPLFNNIDGVTGYADTSTTVSGYSSFAVIVRANTLGFFDAINGSGYSAVNSYAYIANQKYTFRLIVDNGAQTYSAYISQGGGAETTIASNYAFRSDAPATNDMGQIGLVSLQADNQFKIENHTTVQGRVLIANVGAYLYDGVSQGLLTGRKIFDSPGAYIFDGIPANLIQQSPPSYILSALTGVFDTTGINAILTYAAIIRFSIEISASITGVMYLDVSGGQLTTGQAASLLGMPAYSLAASNILFAGAGAYNLDGISGTLLLAKYLIAREEGQYIMDGMSANLVYCSYTLVCQ